MNARIATAVALALLTAAPAAAAAGPNLRAVSVSVPPASVAERATFKVADSIRNAGNARARRSDVRYYLTTDPARSLRERGTSTANPRVSLTDILLEGFRPVPALAAGRTSRTRPARRITVTVPLGTPVGSYYLLACADDRGAVSESDEADNCVASKRQAAVTALPGPDLTIEGYSDWIPDGTDEEEAEAIDFFKSYACPPAAPGKIPSLGKALSGTERWLKEKAPEGVAQFRASADFRDADKAEAAATGALLAKSPGAALAAMVRAHRLEPREASHLITAAALSTSVGRPQEALAFLDGAARLDDRVPGAWGFNRQAVALANRAQALAGLGRFPEAAQAADAARAIEPALAEASSTSATAALCQGNVPLAVAKRREARKRGPRTGPPIDEAFGFEQGVRKLELPAVPAQSPRLLAHYKTQNAERSAEMGKLIDRQTQLEGLVADKPMEPLQRKQGTRLLTAVYRAHTEPRLVAMSEQISDLLTEITEFRAAFFCGDNHCSPERTKYTTFTRDANAACKGNPNEDYSTCYTREMREDCVPALKSDHQAWLGKMEKLYALTDAHHRALSKRMSAIAAHIKDADLHALALVQIDQLEHGAYFLVHQQAFFWTHESNMREDYCIESAVDEPAPADAEAEDAKGQSCPAALKPLNLVLEAGPAALKANCEEIQLEASTPGKWISAFGEISYDLKSGAVTVYAGSKGQVKVPGLKGEFKSGVYVKVGNNGVEDVGWRIGRQVTAGGAPLEYAPKKDMDITFVGIFSPDGQ